MKTGYIAYIIRYSDDEHSRPSGIEEVLTTEEQMQQMYGTEEHPVLAFLQSCVNGLIQPLHFIPSPYRDGVTIEAYVNEEGLCFALPILMGVDGCYGVDGMGSFAGNIVFAGLKNGNTVPLTWDEIMYIEQSLDGDTFNLGSRRQAVSPSRM